MKIRSFWPPKRLPEPTTTITSYKSACQKPVRYCTHTVREVPWNQVFAANRAYGNAKTSICLEIISSDCITPGSTYFTVKLHALTMTQHRAGLTCVFTSLHSGAGVSISMSLSGTYPTTSTAGPSASHAACEPVRLLSASPGAQAMHQGSSARPARPEGTRHPQLPRLTLEQLLEVRACMYACMQCMHDRRTSLCMHA